MQPQQGQPVVTGQPTQYAVNQQVIPGQHVQYAGQQAMGGQSVQYVTGSPMPMGVYPGQQKSKLAAGLLGILIGALGIHNFYLGFTGKGIAQLLITVLSFGILAFIPAIWGLIEGILILTGSMNVDANGIPLTD
jgi:TM2 domain-containing membrane protein YozV